MICPKHKFIFIHIPKTAGRSVRGALRKHCYTTPQEIFRLFDLIRVPLGLQPTKFPKSRYSKLRGHPLGVDYIDHFGEEFFQYYRFTFVRNPYNRMISYYNWKIRNGVIDPNTDFFEFVQSTIESGSFLPQVDFIKGREGEILVNTIGHVESIENDLRRITNDIGVNTDIPHKNRAPRLKDTYFDSRTKDIFDEFYGRDMEYFGYTYSGQ
jgi:hypothetical protein